MKCLQFSWCHSLDLFNFFSEKNTHTNSILFTEEKQKTTCAVISHQKLDGQIKYDKIYQQFNVCPGNLFKSWKFYCKQWKKSLHVEVRNSELINIIQNNNMQNHYGTYPQLAWIQLYWNCEVTIVIP